MGLRDERWATLLTAVSALAVAPATATAAQWSYEPRVTMELEANTNTRLLVTNPVETLKTMLDLGFVLGMKTERTETRS